MTLWFATVFAYWRCLDGRKWPWQVGVVFGLALVTVLVVTVNQREVGIARDETVYMGHGTRYAQWWLGLVTFDHGIDAKTITATFGGREPTGNNREHPPLIKTAMGLSHHELYDTLGIADELTAYRFPNALLAGLLVLLVYAMTLTLWGLREAVIAAVLTLFLPRALFQ